VKYLAAFGCGIATTIVGAWAWLIYISLKGRGPYQ